MLLKKASVEKTNNATDFIKLAFIIIFTGIFLSIIPLTYGVISGIGLYGYFSLFLISPSAIACVWLFTKFKELK